MEVSTRTLRRVLVGLAVLLLAVVAGFVGYARYRAQRFLTGLPGRMGVDIRQETNGFTYSQSMGGRTVFTVHAAKELQRKDGKITLHDVGIVLYGRTADGVGKSVERVDRIHGSEFEYDQAQGVMRALGEVYIDLAGPSEATGEAGKVGAAKDGAEHEPQRVHVKTSGLVYRLMERSAATDAAIAFTGGGFSGDAVGASFDSGTGLLVLRSAVRVSGIRNERPTVLTAAHAELDRSGDVARLVDARYVATTERGAETVSARKALVYLTAGGAPERVAAEGEVTLKSEGGAGSGGEAGQGAAVADRMELEFNAKGQPRTGHMAGAVRFSSDPACLPEIAAASAATTLASGCTQGPEPRERERGRAAEVRVAFDEVGRPVRAVLTGAVDLEEQTGPSHRWLEAEQEHRIRVGAFVLWAARARDALGEAQIRRLEGYLGHLAAGTEHREAARLR